jgi:hypothetical protein
MSKAKPKQKPRKLPDDFASVAKRLGCDQDLKEFDKKLGKIAKATKSLKTGSR